MRITTEVLALSGTIAGKSKGKRRWRGSRSYRFPHFSGCLSWSSRQRRDETGSVREAEGPLSISLPAVGEFVDEGLGWKIHRIFGRGHADCRQPAAEPVQGSVETIHHSGARCLVEASGKDRVVYVLRGTREVGGQIEHVWRSSINLVAVVSCVWLDEFQPGDAVGTYYCFAN
ncbi:hypothetical protein BGZ61DRAFT_436876 [Ilyonectria robusta]|jgi:hypothetical protein|uniref:uncharacterized protein n=1 Tax=Ilyonectria robusta TaxID=1079257 RepID=UPI001E8D843B|nr:uncharacterized protein BGZ61DRAFT_436876 [Ilyonectria robusta]KAH8736712.1 hypothetical protein BGZ61DRAFT_436876 [Ilyonectria robusta]